MIISGLYGNFFYYFAKHINGIFEIYPILENKI